VVTVAHTTVAYETVAYEAVADTTVAHKTVAYTTVTDEQDRQDTVPATSRCIAGRRGRGGLPLR
jgi:hypothetical protein